MIRRFFCAAMALLVLGLVAGCSSSPGSPRHTPSPKYSQLNDQIGQTGPYRGVALRPPQPRPSFTLTDTTGASFAFGSRTAGHPTLLYFGYTRCPDECPATMADIQLALHNVPAAVARRTYVVFVSTDVSYDTGPIIAKWLNQYQRGVPGTFVGLRGTQAQVNAAQAAAHIPLSQDGGHTHSAKVLLFGANDYARVAFVQSTNESQQMAHDLPLAARSKKK